MAQARLEEKKAAFRQMSRAELEELVLAHSRAHARICEIAAYHPQEGGGEHRHASEEEMRERVRSKGTDELVSILADSALAAEAAKAA